METLALVVLFANFALAWSLPRIFFRKDGRLNRNWALTALPFGVAPVLLVLAYAGVLSTLPLPAGLQQLLRVGGLALSVGSIALIYWTLRTHETPLSLWHQENDAPASIVTDGPYALMRHPFYTAFLMALAATMMCSPQVGTILTFAYGVGVMNSTAAREEARLAASEFGAEYAAYRDRTPRFIPRGRR